jgi:hypothetical protein
MERHQKTARTAQHKGRRTHRKPKGENEIFWCSDLERARWGKKKRERKSTRKESARDILALLNSLCMVRRQRREREDWVRRRFHPS